MSNASNIKYEIKYYDSKSKEIYQIKITKIIYEKLINK